MKFSIQGLGIALALTVCAALAVLPHVARAQQMAPPPLTPDQAKADVDILVRALRTLHPALTKYRSSAEMEGAFARFESRGTAARSSSDMYLAATELAAAIRCGHTWTNWRNQGQPLRSLLLDGADKLPFTVTVVEGRWLVLASADASVASGDEIAAINGQSAKELVAMLMPYLRADGSSDGKRLRQLSHDRPDTSQLDILLPLLVPPGDGRYGIDLVRRDGSSSHTWVTAVSMKQRESTMRLAGVLPVNEDWRFSIEDGVGIMVLPTFSFWRSKFDWADFLEQSFAQLHAAKVPNLVIDIRANEGGDGAVGNRLLSYLIHQPLGYMPTQAVSQYEHIDAALKQYLDTWDTRFLDRTNDVEPIAEGTAKGKYQLKSRPAVEKFIQPVAVPYSGKTFLLVGPENSSASYVLAELAQRHHVALLVGEPTGGNRRGLNGGELAWVTLPNSKVAVDIPLLAGRYTASTLDTSVTPDVVVVQRFSARAAGVDQTMNTVRARIKRDMDSK